MIKISQNPTYTAPVNVAIPDDKGQVKTSVFTAVFHRLSTAEIESLYQRINERKIKDADVVAEVLAGWGNDVQGADGQPLTFNDENLAALLAIYPVRPSIVKAYFASITGAQEKN